MTAPLTAPKEGADVRVGNEMGEATGYFIRRTKRVEELIAQPPIMAMADELARHMERYAFEEGVRVQDLDVTVPPTRSKSYIRIVFGAHACIACDGTGRMQDGIHYCHACDGAGHR